MELATAYMRNEDERPMLSILLRSAVRLGRRTGELMDRTWEADSVTVPLRSEVEFDELLAKYQKVMYGTQMPEYFYQAAVSAYTQAMIATMLEENREN